MFQDNDLSDEWKGFMKLWNSHSFYYPNQVTNQRDLELRCIKFAMDEKRTLKEQNMEKLFLLHLLLLQHANQISVKCVKAISILDKG